MIPSCDEIMEGWAFVSRRLGRSGAANRKAIIAALAEAGDLAQAETDEPAALFYAFARRPRALPGGWRLMPRLIAGMHCRRLGLCLRADADTTDRVRTQIVTGSLGFDGVRSWFREHTEPIV